MKWPTAKLGYLGEFRNGLNYTSANHGVGLKVINVADFKDRSIPEYESLGEIDPQGVAGENDLLADGDIVFVRSNGNRDLVGRSLLIENPPAEVSHSAFTIRLRVKSENVSPKFLSYFFRSPLFRKHLSLQGAGTNICNLNQRVLGELDVPSPERRVQDAASDFLATYDNAMENNRRRMGLLEKAARLLYEEWFVRLRFPGYEHTRILHGLPEGWTRKLLEEIAEFRLGKMLDQEKNRGELMPYLANVNVRWGEFDWRDLREMRFEHDELEAFGLKYGDIVMCEGGEPGRCAIWKEQMPGMMIQKAIHRIRCRENMNPEYLYHSLRHHGASGHLATLFTGATIKHLPREKLAKVTVVVPPAQLMDVFVNYARPIETQLKLLEAATNRASEARDLLLPRLMSGEIEV